MLSQRSQNLGESLTLVMTDIAKNLKANGEKVISFSAGEPDFDTPKIIKDAAISAIEKGCGAYTPVVGIKEVIEAIQYKFKNDNNLEYKANEIITNVGAKHSLFMAIECLVQEGDEVIIPSPYWVSYPEMVKFAGGTPVFIEGDAKNGFKITPEQLKNALTPKTKVLMFNSPSNPTGSIYSKEEIIALAKVLEGSKVVVLSDEIYEKLVYDGKFYAFAQASEDAFNRTVSINGLSKCGAMPGWRFGYMASKMSDFNNAVKKLQGQSTSNICSIIQHAALPALLGKANADIESMRQAFLQRRELACKILSQCSKLKLEQIPQGAFYLFISCKEVDGDSMRFCKRLLEEEKVALVPGIGFGMEGYFRLSYATNEKDIEEGCQKIVDFVKRY
ncbi:pyridoxal phosphate-dependent aminotransferase [Campylobacter insulaenigrae]|uniref:Pyridoxal phosphate-dependent aminotransferase n=1 Tax=Campylobacter insulaenigrae TaxID=260714 RepID=A0ABY3G7L1_9BACT|nr:pyridoxal phosphate-dependent aminotransferase [Campylobacter insulaenigrae]MCR6570851.1 pyridoxal phosphate-dependent aminotransferase [Campylobacter insulaenigrae]MCR6572491.1 pyridoxal phosphate-dependent aminotransferase [Campylobacter insulaenigrae]MCR6573459.1 pyridoxal phosphate-dependent aminotransferase [Campylobacter insulaenigrae]MCR6576862.1 pyridoxal phosphate-dependent aminotransferase [Campylobacter insulaenigrae]MCR6578400.1 pyridoxal phosphate-dependent aminotransferase [Ca